jgi:hypothetical protein
MERTRRATLHGLTRELAAYPWAGAEVDDLVAPSHGLITGYQELLDELEQLRRSDLGFIPPAQGLTTRRGER